MPSSGGNDTKVKKSQSQQTNYLLEGEINRLTENARQNRQNTPAN